MPLTPKRTIRYYLLRFVRLRGSPYSLAMGTALGIFIGISPTIPLHTVAIIGITLALRVSTLAGLIAGTAVCNPLTLVPQYYLCWKVGDLSFPGRLSWERIREILTVLKESGFLDSLKSLSHLSTDAILVMLTGGVVIGLPLAVIGYCVTFRFFATLQAKRRRKHILHPGNKGQS